MKYYLLCAISWLLATPMAGQGFDHLIPQPQSIVLIKGTFEINGITKIVYNSNCASEAQILRSFLELYTGWSLPLVPFDQLPKENYILLESPNLDPGLQLPTTIQGLPGNLNQQLAADDHEAYRLNITPKSVVVFGQTTAGVGHAIRTLQQLTPYVEERDKSIPTHWSCAMIQDKPAFPHRGLLLDCCRHFMDVDFIKKYIDLLAYYKMNVLHWHLTEDQGWRIEIKKYPKLTSVGGYRKETDGTVYGGYYSQEQIKDIVAYAQERHITIIPEIEMPGHSVAALASYPHLSCTQQPIEVETEWGVFKDIYCAGNDKTIEFLKDVLTEVCALFPGPYIHIGGDEAPKYRWEHCEKCQKRMTDEKLANEAALQTWLIEEMAAFLKTKNKSIIGWDEILEGGIPADAAIQSWRGMEGGVAGAKAKHAVVMSPTSHCYFDYGLQSIDAEKVYLFDPIPSILTREEAAYIRGGECNMWTEHAPQNLVDSKVFPRLLALSEVLWTYPSNRDYKTFAHKIDAHYPRLSKMGVQYGLPKLASKVSFSKNADQKMVVQVDPGFAGVSFIYDEFELPTTDFTLTEDREAIEPYIGEVPESIELNGPIVPMNASRLTITPIYGNKAIQDQRLSLYIHQHLGYGKPLKRNFTTNKYYPSTGDNAFADGLCYSSGFRDGYWQGVVQKDLEIISDMASVQTIQFCNSHWYHYANAWIFRPDRVIYYSSLDGNQWTELGRFEAAIEASDKRETPLLYPIWFKPQQARYVKMVVNGIGACPSWHDAPGEPSWLFGDELIIR